MDVEGHGGHRFPNENAKSQSREVQFKVSADLVFERETKVVGGSDKNYLKKKLYGIAKRQLR